MADTLSINVTADATSLRAQLARAQEDLRAFAAQLRETAQTARDAGAAIADPGGGAAAPSVAAATARVARLRGELRGLGDDGAATTLKLAAAGREAADKFAAPFRRAFDHLGSSIEHALTDVLTGTTTWRKAYREMYRAAVGAGIGLLGSTASKIVARPLSALLGQDPGKPGEGVGDVLGNTLSSWVGKGLSTLIPSLGSTVGGMLGKAAADTAGATASAPILTGAMVAGATAAAPILTAAMSAGGAATAAGGAVSAAGSAAGAAGGGGFFGWIASLLPFARGGIVPAAAGGWALPRSFGSDRIMAALTPGEMVLPTGISQGLQAMIAGAGAPGAVPAINIAPGGQIFDGPSFARYLQREGRDVLRKELRLLMAGTNPYR